MSSNSADFIFKQSAIDKRPALIFVHSVHCYSSRQFIREVMSQEDITHTIKMNFNCMNADVTQNNGRGFASRNNYLVMPVLVLYSHDASLKYQCALKLDKEFILDQIRNFLTACNIKNQIQLLSQTNEHVSPKVAAFRIGESYARIDMRKVGSLSPDMNKNVARFTLNSRYFKDFEEGYLTEWKRLLAKKEETKPE